jgi:hypothetical protein
VVDVGEEQALPSAADVDVHRLHREGVRRLPVGTTVATLGS